MSKLHKAYIVFPEMYDYRVARIAEPLDAKKVASIYGAIRDACNYVSPESMPSYPPTYEAAVLYATRDRGHIADTSHLVRGDLCEEFEQRLRSNLDELVHDGKHIFRDCIFFSSDRNLKDANRSFLPPMAMRTRSGMQQEKEKLQDILDTVLRCYAMDAGLKVEVDVGVELNIEGKTVFPGRDHLADIISYVVQDQNAGPPAVNRAATKDSINMIGLAERFAGISVFLDEVGPRNITYLIVYCREKYPTYGIYHNRNHFCVFPQACFRFLGRDPNHKMQLFDLESQMFAAPAAIGQDFPMRIEARMDKSVAAGAFLFVDPDFFSGRVAQVDTSAWM